MEDVQVLENGRAKGLRERREGPRTVPVEASKASGWQILQRVLSGTIPEFLAHPNYNLVDYISGRRREVIDPCVRLKQMDHPSTTLCVTPVETKDKVRTWRDLNRSCAQTSC